MSEVNNERVKNIHDCYNTIAAITCYAQFLMQDIPPHSEMHKFAKSIFVYSKRAKLLLDDISKETNENKNQAKRVVRSS